MYIRQCHFGSAISARIRPPHIPWRLSRRSIILLTPSVGRESNPYVTSHRLRIRCTRHRSRAFAVASANLRRSCVCVERPAHGPTVAPITHRSSIIETTLTSSTPFREKIGRNEKGGGAFVAVAQGVAASVHRVRAHCSPRAGCKTPRRLRVPLRAYPCFRFPPGVCLCSRPRLPRDRVFRRAWFVQVLS